MFNLQQKQNRLQELGVEVKRVANNPALTPSQKSAFMDRAEAEATQIETDIRNDKKASQWMADSEIGLNGGRYFDGGTKTAGRKWSPPSPLQASQEQFKNLYAAAKNRLPSYGFEVGVKGVGDFDIGVKTPGAPISESGLGGFPAILEPGQTQALPFEPDRLFEHFRGATMAGPSVEYLVQGPNTNAAKVTAELEQKVDIGISLTAKTVSATKIAALASVSMEALQDFEYFQNFVPAALQKALVDAETDFVVNSNTSVKGLLHTAGTLSRPVGADLPLDAIQLAINDLRVGAQFATANLIAWHPTTASYVKRQKDKQDRYLLAPDPQTGQVNTVWNCNTVENTKIPIGTAIVLDSTVAVLAWTRMGLTLETNRYGDTEWTTNAVSFRCEERIAIGVTNPAAICVVTGLAEAGS